MLKSLIVETGATALHWSRAYDPEAIERDKAVKAAIGADGLTVQSHVGHIMFEPWTVETKTGGFYRVYTPFWNSVKGRDVPAPQPAPAKIPSPDDWPVSDRLADWKMEAA